MAIDDIVVTKVSVVELFRKNYTVTFNMICMASSAEVINQDFPIMKEDTDDEQSFEDKAYGEMAEYIERYNREQTRFNHPSLDTVVSNIQTALSSSYVT